MKNDVKLHIDSLIKNHDIVLFMKGTKDRPQCGFSKQVVEVLNNVVSDFMTIDVLADPEIRDGIKAYSNWPTIPQLYIDGEFIGGCDIVLELFRKNELQNLVHLPKATVSPTVKITDAAVTAFKNALSEGQEPEAIRLTIGLDFEHGLSFDQKQLGDFSLNYDGLEIVIDPYSAVRANNLSIDYLTENFDAGFAFANPNEPPLVKELSVEAFNDWHQQGTDALLIDVRPKSEWNMAHISFAKSLSDMSPADISALKKDQAIVFHCHHGGRSLRMAESFRKKGFTNLYNLTGGIDAWSKKIDHNVPVYTK